MSRVILVAQRRRQQVVITSLGAAPAAAPANTESQVWTRVERAHRRWNWANRVARNASGDATPRWLVPLDRDDSRHCARAGGLSRPAASTRPLTLVPQFVDSLDPRLYYCINDLSNDRRLQFVANCAPSHMQ